MTSHLSDEQRGRDEHVFLYYRSPDAIRGEEFTHRMRGLDEAEVREYLSLLADQVQAADWERAQLVTENERLRLETERLKAQGQHAPASSAPAPVPAATASSTAQLEAHAAAVLTQAQEVADQLVNEAVRHAQRLIAAAQTQGREVVRHARETAQNQLRAVLDGLDEEMVRIGTPGLPGQVPPPAPLPGPLASSALFYRQIG